MAKKMGIYCKAYKLSALRGFPDWQENSDAARAADEGKSPRPLDDNSILYVQENHVVTDGVFIDENVIFDAVTPEWVSYCQETLQFEIPEDVRRANERNASAS